MPARIPNVSGNWSDSSNWYTVANTWSLHGSLTHGLTTSARNLNPYTAPSTTASCVGVALFIDSRTAETDITISLQENTVSVRTKTFTGNTIPLNRQGWYFFRFDTPYQYTTTTANAYRFSITANTSTATTFLRLEAVLNLSAYLALDDRTGAVSATDDAFILADVGGSAKTIAFDQNDPTTTCLSLQIGNNATLAFTTTMTTQMILGNGTTSTLANIFPGGTFAVGTVTNPIPAAYTATLQLDGSSTSTTTAGVNCIAVYSGASGAASATFSAVGDPSYNSRARTMEGYATGWYATTLASNAASGATTITLTDDLGLRPGGGDVIGVSEFNSDTAYRPAEIETRTVTSYNPATKTVTFSPALTVTHGAGAIVNNVTRNVTIKSLTTTRLGQIVTVGSNTVPVPTMTLQHVLFESMQRVGNQSQNSSYTPFGHIDIVGCAWHSPSSTSSLGFQTFCQGRIINCHCHKNALLNSFNTVSVPQTTSLIQVVGCSASGTPSGVIWIQGWGAVVKECLISAWNVAACSHVRFVDCVVTDCQYLLTQSYSCEHFNTIVNSAYNLVENVSNCIFDGLKITNNLIILSTGNNNLFVDCEWVNSPLPAYWGFYTYFGIRDSYYRMASFQNCTSPSMPSAFSLYMGGQIRRYTSATAPQPVFPLPSGASVANRIESISANTAYGITQWFYIPVTSGARNNTVTIPVYLSGWGSPLPTNAELYVELYVPGIKVPVVSTSTVTANDQWQYLTVSAVSTNRGYLMARLVLRKYHATAVMYVDWPLGMSTANLDWYEGRPNEYLTPLPTYTAGQDFKSLRIDGPGYQEFKVPVNSRLTKFQIKAKYDTAHGTTNKPRALILAQSNLGITQQTATMTAGADTWETLNLSFTPTQAGTVTLRFESRAAQPWGRAWFDTFTAE